MGLKKSVIFLFIAFAFGGCVTPAAPTSEAVAFGGYELLFPSANRIVASFELPEVLGHLNMTPGEAGTLMPTQYDFRIEWDALPKEWFVAAYGGERHEFLGAVYSGPATGTTLSGMFLQGGEKTTLESVNSATVVLGGNVRGEFLENTGRERTWGVRSFDRIQEGQKIMLVVGKEGGGNPIIQWGPFGKWESPKAGEIAGVPPSIVGMRFYSDAAGVVETRADPFSHSYTESPFTNDYEALDRAIFVGSKVLESALPTNHLSMETYAYEGYVSLRLQLHNALAQSQNQLSIISENKAGDWLDLNLGPHEGEALLEMTGGVAQSASIWVLGHDIPLNTTMLP